jgi:hypothetical protein
LKLKCKSHRSTISNINNKKKMIITTKRWSSKMATTFKMKSRRISWRKKINKEIWLLQIRNYRLRIPLRKLMRMNKIKTIIIKKMMIPCDSTIRKRAQYCYGCKITLVKNGLILLLHAVLLNFLKTLQICQLGVAYSKIWSGEGLRKLSRIQNL